MACAEDQVDGGDLDEAFGHGGVPRDGSANKTHMCACAGHDGDGLSCQWEQDRAGRDRASHGECRSPAFP